MNRIFLILVALSLFGASCRAEPGSAGNWSHLSIQVPPGYRLAVSSLLPGARIVERSRFDPDAGDSALPHLVALFEPPGGSGYFDRGVWLLDRVHLIRRAAIEGEAGAQDTDPQDVGSVAGAMDGAGQARLGATDSLRSWITGGTFDDGAPRFAVSPSIEARLGAAHPLLAALAAHGWRMNGAASIEDLLQGRLDAALLDGAEAAAFHRREYPSRDLLEEIPLEDGARELRLYATRNRMDLGGAVEILLKSRMALVGLGYDPAR